MSNRIVNKITEGVLKTLNERKVLKVGTKKPTLPPMQNTQPPVDDDLETQDNMEMASDDISTDMGMENEQPEKSFDNDFDAGVEADEDEDPKRYIQQLTGKLSQKLRDYNESQGEPDADLNKYVAGMILKQSVEGLSEEDKNEIIKKVNEDSDDNESSNEQDGEEMNSEEPSMVDMPMEGKREKRNILFSEHQIRIIKESLNNELEIDRETERAEMKFPKEMKVSKKHSPFMPPVLKEDSEINRFYVKCVECYIEGGEDIVFVAALTKYGDDGEAIKRVERTYPLLEIVDVYNVDGYLEEHNPSILLFDHNGVFFLNDDPIEHVDDLQDF